MHLKLCVYESVQSTIITISPMIGHFFLPISDSRQSVTFHHRVYLYQCAWRMRTQHLATDLYVYIGMSIR